jgi:hypothetical protein
MIGCERRAVRCGYLVQRSTESGSVWIVEHGVATGGHGGRRSIVHVSARRSGHRRVREDRGAELGRESAWMRRGREAMTDRKHLAVNGWWQGVRAAGEETT